MPSSDSPKAATVPKNAPVVEHVTRAHQLLKSLEDKIGEHPALAEAILKLENALSLLTIETGGML